MKNLKSVNEFWNLFKSKEEEEKQPETKKELSYDEICDKIVDNFDDIRAVDHYMQLLKKIGKEKEFLNSEKGKHFIEMRKNMR
jgi:hypothetical protein